MGIAMQAEVRFQPFARAALERVIHAPVAAVSHHGDAVDDQREVVQAGDFVGDFADAEGGGLHIGRRAAGIEAQTKGI